MRCIVFWLVRMDPLHILPSHDAYGPGTPQLEAGPGEPWPRGWCTRRLCCLIIKLVRTSQIYQCKINKKNSIKGFRETS